MTNRSLQHSLESVKDILLGMMGLNLDSIPRDDAYVLLNAGRRIEKGLLLISQIRSAFVTSHAGQVEYSLMESLLTCNTSHRVYRSRFRSYLQLEPFLDLLLFDAAHPSSLMHQLGQLKDSLCLLPARNKSVRLRKEEILVLEAYSMLQRTEPSMLTRNDTGLYHREDLDFLLSSVYQLLLKTSDALVAEYFAHSELPGSYKFSIHYD